MLNIIKEHLITETETRKHKNFFLHCLGYWVKFINIFLFSVQLGLKVKKENKNSYQKIPKYLYIFLRNSYNNVILVVYHVLLSSFWVLSGVNRRAQVSARALIRTVYVRHRLAQISVNNHWRLRTVTFGGKILSGVTVITFRRQVFLCILMI